MTDPLEGSSSLFESVLSGISEQQWEDYKKERRLENEEFIFDEDSDESFLDDSRSNSPVAYDEENVVNVDLVEEGESAYGVESTGNEIMAKTCNETWGSDAVLRYLNGEIPFMEFAETMEISRSKDHRPTAINKEDELRGTVSEEDKSQKVKKTRKRFYELPKQLIGFMGAANLSYANGKKDEAIQICMRLLQEAPAAQEPYQLLAMIYEEMGDMKKSLQCSLLASYLNPSDTEEWIRLASLSLEQSQIHQAIKCYSFAIRNEPTNINFLFERCNLYELVEDRRNALLGYELILKNLSNPDDGKNCISIAKEIAKLHHESEDYINAIKILEIAFSKFPALVTSEDVNLLLELQITQKCYKAAAKNFIQHCGVQFRIGDQTISLCQEFEELNDDQLKTITRCSVPGVLHLDLQMKLLVCLIHIHALESCKDLLSALKATNPNDLGDLYLDVAEAFMDIEEYSEAEMLLISLVTSENYNLAAVWLKYGDCLTKLNQAKDARKAYQTVIEMAPSHQEARVSLSRLLIEGGRKIEAVTALKQEYEDGKKDSVLDCQVLLERCNLLYELGHFEEFIAAATLAQYSHSIYLKTRDEYFTTISNLSYRSRKESLREMKSIRNRLKPVFTNVETSESIHFDLFLKLCRKLFELKYLVQLQNVCLTALTSSAFRKSPTMVKDVDMLAMLSCIYNEDYAFAYSLIRETINRDINLNRGWNLLCYFITLSQEVRHYRFCLRHLLKKHDHLALSLFNGHNAMNSGSYKHALGEYMNLLKKYPDDSSLMFYVGITFIHMASQKFSTRRHLLIIQGVHFLLRYIELEKESQESLYNMARSLHQLGIKDIAVQYYKKALDAKPAVFENEDPATFDLRHEIAFNLSLIYQGSGSSQLSSLYLRTYNVV